jgi:acid phosphatase
MDLRRGWGGVIAVFVLATGVLWAQQAPVAAKQLPGRFAPVAPGERIENLDTLKEKVRAYHECTCRCGCYAKDMDLQADRAIAYLRQWAAHREKPAKPAIVLDIDETTLSNYKEMLDRGFAYDSKAFNTWVESAQATAIPGTLRVVKEAQKLGVVVIYLTGRPETQRAATEKNLDAQGFGGWAKLILRTPDEAGLTAQDYKSAERAKMVAAGYTLVLNMGDQWSDLRGNPEAAYSVKYPDPYYFLK